jgi:hypothetical protein
VTNEDDGHGTSPQSDKAAIAERNNYLVLRGWYLEGGHWTHEKLPATHRVDAETAQRIQQDWDAGAS